MTTQLHRLVPAAVLLAAATLGGSAVGNPAIACAVPEWDVDYYDRCVATVLADYQSGKRDFEHYNIGVVLCCENSGGIWTESQGCVAPPAEQAQPTLPGTAPRPGVATQPPPPPPPPVVRNPGVAPRPGVIETFTPAPIG